MCRPPHEICNQVAENGCMASLPEIVLPLAGIEDCTNPTMIIEPANKASGLLSDLSCILILFEIVAEN